MSTESPRLPITKGAATGGHSDSYEQNHLQLSSAAVEYAELGMAVLPLAPVRFLHDVNGSTCRCDGAPLPLACVCRDGAACENVGKHPVAKLVPHGKDDASTDPAVVAEWWKRCPDANVGVVVPQGFVVLDIDPRNGGDTNLLSLMDSCGGCLPETREAYTGGRGWHLWYRYGGPVIGKLCPGVDVRSSTGYVVMPPSMHLSGTRYQWVRELPWPEIPPLPMWVRKLLDPPQVLVPSGRRGNGNARGLIKRMKEAAEGNRHLLLCYCCRAARDEGWSQADIDALAQAAVRPDHTWSEVVRTMKSYGLSVGGAP